VPTVVALPTNPSALTVGRSAELFLDSLGNPNTLRAYGTGVGKTADRLGEQRPLAAVADDEVGEALELLWGSSAVNTWNARRAVVLAWLSWCRDRGGQDVPTVPGWTKRLAVPDSETRCVPGSRSTAWWRAARSHSGRRRSTGCSMKPPPAPKRSSGSTSRTSTWPDAAPR
jgi:hypothetical protein